MSKIKQTRRPGIDYPSGRGTGLGAAGVHAVDRKLGATPTDFNKVGYAGSPSTSADVGFSRALARVNKGYEGDKAKEDVQDVSWLKLNAKGLEDMGLTPKVIAELYSGILTHRPRTLSESERIGVLAESVRVLRLSAERKTRLSEGFDPDRSIGDQITDLVGSVDIPFIGDDSAASPTSVVDSFSSDDIVDSFDSPATRRAVRGIDVERSADILTDDEDQTDEIISCDSVGMQVFHVALAVLGVFEPVGIAADLINCVSHLICKNYFHAMIDLIAVIPGIGDTAKIFYAERLLSRAGRASGAARTIRGVGTRADQAEAAAVEINAALSRGDIGPKMGSAITRLERFFGSAQQMATRLRKMLEVALDKAIALLARVQGGGSMPSRAAAALMKRMPINVLDILKRVRAKGPEELGKFIYSIFGTRAKGSGASPLQMTTSGFEVKSAIFDKHSEDADQDALAASQNYDYDPDAPTGADDDLNYNGVSDRVETERYGSLSRPGSRRGMMGGMRDYAPLYEAKRGKKTKKVKLSLVKAMTVDDDDLDEFSSAAMPGVALPLGMSTPGKHKSLDKLVPGYSFATGRFPYSR